MEKRVIIFDEDLETGSLIFECPECKHRQFNGDCYYHSHECSKYTRLASVMGLISFDGCVKVLGPAGFKAIKTYAGYSTEDAPHPTLGCSLKTIQKYFGEQFVEDQIKNLEAKEAAQASKQ